MIHGLRSGSGSGSAGRRRAAFSVEVITLHNFLFPRCLVRNQTPPLHVGCTEVAADAVPTPSRLIITTPLTLPGHERKHACSCEFPFMPLDRFGLLRLQSCIHSALHRMRGDAAVRLASLLGVVHAGRGESTALNTVSVTQKAS